jgi:hypothetical protein
MVVAHELPIEYTPRETGQPGLRMVEPFVILRKAMLYDLTLTPQLKILYLVIADQAWRDETGTCRLSHGELAQLVGRETRTVRALVKPLVDCGLLGQKRTGPTQAKAYWPIDPGEQVGHRPKNDGVSDRDGGHRPKNDATPSENGRSHRPKNDGYLNRRPDPETPEIKRPAVASQPAGPGGATEGEFSSQEVSTSKPPKPRPSPSAIALSPGAQAVMDHYAVEWGAAHPTLNPTQVRLLEEAVAEIGADEIMASVTYLAGDGVRGIDKARRGALNRLGKNPIRAGQLAAATRGDDRPPSRFLETRDRQAGRGRFYGASPVERPYDGTRHGGGTRAQKQNIRENKRF